MFARLPRLHQARLSWGLVAIAACLACADAAPDETADVAGDDAAIRQRANAYLRAIERGDADEIASFWTEDGDYVDESGQAVKGRQLAKQAEARSADADDARRLEFKVESLRFITADIGIEDGALRVTDAPVGQAVVRRYTAIWVRQDDTWLLDGVRELAASGHQQQNHLSDLAWMLGDWSSDADNQSIRLTCTWSDDKHFLLREIEVHTPDRGPLHVSQRIGWDARERQIRSWTFDSEGGHGEGLWFRSRDRWIVEAASVLADGSRATGTNIYTHDGPHSFTWQATNSETDGEPMPDREVRMVRRKASGE